MKLREQTTRGGPWKVAATVVACVALLVPLVQSKTTPVFAETAPCGPDATSAGAPCTVTTTIIDDSTVDYRIDQPVVTLRTYDYRSIVFHPGDQITINAGGCVQTGGTGGGLTGSGTWKRYVNPTGSDSGPPGGLYWGSIAIPFVQYGTRSLGTLLAFQDLLPGYPDTPTTVTVPQLPALANHFPPHLILGYEDDEYTDNGYYDHDDGDDDQCKNVGSAWVTLHVHHGIPFTWTNGPAKNWDLVENGFDANGLFLNPVWGWQINGGHLDPEGSNNPACYPGCSSQNPTYDNPSNKWFQIPNRLLAKVCQDNPIYDPLPGLATSGHRNWFDATYTGSVQWVEHSDAVSGDDDYNMRLQTPHNLQGAVDAAGTSAKNQEDPFHEADLGVEFDSDETIDKFTENRFWTAFHTAVDNDDGMAHRMIDGHDAIVIGLVGIDEMHSPHVEIHPVHALAVRLDGPTTVDASDDRWAIFVRNWGNEGECSSNQHYLDRNDITIQLPAPASATPGATATLNPSTNFYHLGASAASDFYSGGDGTFVTFHLLSGTNQGFAYGELDLNWTGGPGVARVSMQRHARALDQLLRTLHQLHQHRPHVGSVQRTQGRPRLATHLNAPDPEEALGEIWDSMTPVQQQTALRLYGMLYQPPAVPTVPLQWHVATAPPQLPVAPPKVSEAFDPVGAQQDKARLQALCAATNGQLPTEFTNGWCADFKFGPLTTLNTTGGAAGLNGWLVTPVTATLTAYDSSGSGGIASTEYSYDQQTWHPYTGSFILPDGDYTVYYRSTDRNGSVEATQKRAFKIDTTPPNITITSPTTGPYIVGQTVTAGFTCTDATSGVARCTGTANSGASFAIGSLGTHDFTVNASDAAGNTAVKTVTYRVQYGVQLLYNPPYSTSSGNTVPIKLDLLAYVNGLLTNVSSSSLTVQALCVVPAGTQACTGTPPIDFRAGTPQYFTYTAGTTNAGRGYQFNVKTLKTMKGLFQLLFRVKGEDSGSYHADAGATFMLK